MRTDADEIGVEAIRRFANPCGDMAAFARLEHMHEPDRTTRSEHRVRVGHGVAAVRATSCDFAKWRSLRDSNPQPPP